MIKNKKNSINKEALFNILKKIEKLDYDFFILYANNSSGKTRSLKSVKKPKLIKTLGVTHNSAIKEFELTSNIIKKPEEGLDLDEKKIEFQKLLKEINILNLFNKKLIKVNKNKDIKPNFTDNIILDQLSTSERQIVVVSFAILFSSSNATIVIDDVMDGFDEIRLVQLLHWILDNKNPKQKIVFLSKDMNLHTYFVIDNQEYLKSIIFQWNGKTFAEMKKIRPNMPYNEKEIKTKIGLIYWLSIYFEVNKKTRISFDLKRLFDSIFLHLHLEKNENNQKAWNELQQEIPEYFKKSKYFFEVITNDINETLNNWNLTVNHLMRTQIKLSENNIHHYFLIIRSFLDLKWRELSGYDSNCNTWKQKQDFYRKKTSSKTNFMGLIYFGNKASHKFINGAKFIVDNDFENQKEFLNKHIEVIRREFKIEVK